MGNCLGWNFTLLMGVSLFTQFLTVCLGPPTVRFVPWFCTAPKGFWNSTYEKSEMMFAVSGDILVFETKNMGNWARESWNTYLNLFQWNDSPRWMLHVFYAPGGWIASASMKVFVKANLPNHHFTIPSGKSWILAMNFGPTQIHRKVRLVWVGKQGAFGKLFFQDWKL